MDDAETAGRARAAHRRQSELLNIQISRRAASQAEHRTSAAAIARGSSVEAEDAMRFHLDEVRDAIAIALTQPAPV